MNQSIKQTARVIIEGCIKNNKLILSQGNYNFELTNKVKKAVDNGELDLSEIHKFILVPNTLNPNGNVSNEDLPYLDFLVIGIVRNQSNINENVVNITGKIIYENIKYDYVLVKLEISKNSKNDQKIKLYGTLEDSIVNDKGTAVESLYDIQCIIEDKQLIIVDSYRITQTPYLVKTYKSNKTNNIIEFPQLKQAA